MKAAPTGPSELDTLRRLVADVAKACKTEPYEVIIDLGFELLDPPENFGYHCTPVNALTFGATGGDGVHLSLLDGEPCNGAVVLTTPNGDNPNAVVAETFGDFLRLGYFGGWGWLEQLGYVPNPATLQSQYSQEVELAKPARRLIQDLRSTFALEPFGDVAAHFARLQKYTGGCGYPIRRSGTKRTGFEWQHTP
jgi:hypothetical protein